AEMAVPVRAELVANVGDLDNRRRLAWSRLIDNHRREVRALARAIPSLGDLLAGPRQSLDNLTLRLQGGLATLARIKRRDFQAVAGRMTPQLLARNARVMAERVATLAGRMDRAV